MRPITKLVLFVFVCTFIVPVAHTAFATDPNQKVLDMLTGGKKREGTDSGCAFRYVTVRQISLGGGAWSDPIVIPDPGYGNGYMMVKKSNWYPSDRISPALAGSGISMDVLKESVCGRQSGQLIDGTDIYVRTGKTAAWKTGKDTSTYPATVYRDIKVGCFARAKHGDQCQ